MKCHSKVLAQGLSDKHQSEKDEFTGVQLLARAAGPALPHSIKHRGQAPTFRALQTLRMPLRAVPVVWLALLALTLRALIPDIPVPSWWRSFLPVPLGPCLTSRCKTSGRRCFLSPPGSGIKDGVPFCPSAPPHSHTFTPPVPHQPFQQKKARHQTQVKSRAQD